MTSSSLNRIAILGVGLIGGSLARGLRRNGFCQEIIGYDSDPEMLAWAVDQRVIDDAASSLLEAVAGAELVVLAVPVGATPEVLAELKSGWPEACILTDVGSSKVSVIKAVESVFADSSIRFVPGHPIAGKEYSSVKASSDSLFQRHRVILTPISDSDPAAIETVSQMWQAVGAEVKTMSPQQHDLVMGATSHLPHVLAYTTVNTLAGLDFVEEIFEFAAGGFRDFSRIASSDPIMWRDICLNNGPAILNVLDQFESELTGIRTAIERVDGDALEAAFTRSKTVRDTFLQKYELPMNTTAQHSAKTTIRVAGVPEHFNLPWHLAIESDAFSDSGVAVEFREYSGGTGEMIEALAAGEVDLAILLAEGAVADVASRGRSKLVKVYVESPLIWGIHVAADSEIENLAQIKDSTYAISRYGSGSHLMAIVDAAERGWDPDQLEFEVIEDLAGARVALSRSTADTFFWEKFTTQPFVDNGEFRRIGQRETLWPAFVIAADVRALETRSDAIRKVLEQVNRSCVQLMDDPDAADLIAQRYGLRVEQVRQWLKLTKWNHDFERPTESLQQVLNYLKKLGIVTSEQVDVDDLWTNLEI